MSEMEFFGLLEQRLRRFCELAPFVQYALLVLICIFSALFSWRVWRFTISPLMRPNEPPELPYWIPVIGHAIPFLRDQDRLLTYARSYFGVRPFSLTIVGAKIYFQTSLADISATYKSGKTVSFETNTREFMSTWGMSADGNEKIWRRGYDGIFPNPQGKSLAQITNTMCKVQMCAGEGLEALTETFKTHVQHALQWDKLSSPSTQDVRVGSEVDVSLSELCRTVLVDAGTRTFFGSKLLELQPDMDHQFLLFDTDSWKLMFQLPPSFAKPMYASRAVLLDALQAYYDLPSSEKQDSCWLIQAMEEEMKALNMSSRDAALNLFLFYWLANVNSYKLSFWILSYVLSSPGLLSALQQESAAAYDPATQTLDASALTVDACPLLNAVFDEAIRLTNSAMSARTVEQDTVLNGYAYRAGCKLLIPYRQLHFNERVFGPASPQDFHPERFLQDATAKSNSTTATKNQTTTSTTPLSANPNYKPFGGGNSLCTGRFLARREVLVFVALTLQRFDMSLPRVKVGQGQGVDKAGDALEREQKFPRLDATKPGLGILEPVEGDDLVVRMRMRRRKEA